MAPFRSGSGSAGSTSLRRTGSPRPLHPVAQWLATVVQPRANLTTDSRAIEPGDVFIAVKGAQFDGRHFIPDAIARGAAAVVYDATAFAWRDEWRVPNRPERELKRQAGSISADWYRRPAEGLLTIGVTGTSGKTTTALWLAQALSAIGRRTVMVGTLGIGFPEDLDATGNTTPDPVLLHRRLRALVDAGADAMAMEVTSIGIEEGRIVDMIFDIAVFTNLTRDHLDYHGSMAAYEAAKAKLFHWPGLAHAVVNVDDPAGARVAQIAADAGAEMIRTSASGTAQAELRARKVSVRADGLGFEIFGAFGVRQVHTDFIGNFNIANLLGVVGTLLAAGASIDTALGALDALAAVPGRLERVLVGREERPGGIPVPMVLVDYAHKPDALEKVLAACRPIVEARDGELIVVFGCGGDRDTGKRPIMGEIAARLADRVVVTSDNPRTEDPDAIIEQIVNGIGQLGFNPLSSGYTGLSLDERVTVRPDRRTAIYEAIAHARAADVVVIAGKGHESYQEINGQKLPFSDVAVAREALRRERRRQERGGDGGDREPRAC
jgi:UDP-N-acetylmuramoyl-L-alanyl-D-glutamate--2,6-diaminopimelate ligase